MIDGTSDAVSLVVEVIEGVKLVAQVAALSQLQLLQHGVDAEDSDPFQDYRVWDPLLTSQLQCSADAAEMEVIRLSGLIGLHIPNLCSVQKCRHDDRLVHLQLGVQSKAVVIPRGDLQPTECLADVGDSMGDLVAEFRAARSDVGASGGKEVHAALHVLFGRGAKRSVVCEEQVVDRSRR
nr:unnamed protein product [Spirometra erinaceieuropaei]